MLLVVSFLVILGIIGIVFLNRPMFGKLPTGERLSRIQQSPNYKGDHFENLEYTPNLTEGESYWKVMGEFFFNKSKRSQPFDSLKAQKVDLLHLDPTQNVLVWFGHSSYFMQVNGKKMLVDPVFSGSASPVRFTTPSYRGTDVYQIADLPPIDYLFLSHDHWDHIDYETIKQLQPKVVKALMGLGVGAHLEHWGYTKEQIIETDWNDETILDSGFKVVTTPARHFSGRGLRPNKSLWVSFALYTPSIKVFIGGDSGYGKHFKQIGEQHGPFDLALLECGQYDLSWKYIHMLPEEVVLAAEDLKAEKLMPVHWSKFTLGNHAWDEPIIRVTKEAKRRNMPVLHPAIGQMIGLSDSVENVAWWEVYK